MNELNVPELQPHSNTKLSLDYLLKELEFQVAIETKARDRTENMVQYLLTTIAAIIGAALVVNELQINSILLLSIAFFLVFVFSVSAFYRTCRLRYITTYSRVTRNKIRCELVKLGVNEANHLIEWEGNPSGFGDRMQERLILMMIFCCLLGGVTGFFALLLVFHITKWPILVTGSQKTLLIMVPLALIVGTSLILLTVLRSQKRRSEQFITDYDWLDLPDYDL